MASFAHASLNTPSTNQPTNSNDSLSELIELGFEQCKKHTVFFMCSYCALKWLVFGYRADQNRNLMMLISNVSSAIFFIAVSLYLRSMPFFQTIVTNPKRIEMKC